jgi:hypothetical protein
MNPEDKTYQSTDDVLKYLGSVGKTPPKEKLVTCPISKIMQENTFEWKTMKDIIY